MGTKSKIAIGVVVGVAIGAGGYYAYQRYAKNDEPDCGAVEAKGDVDPQNIPDPDGKTA